MMEKKSQTDGTSSQSQKLTPEEIEVLFTHNMNELNKMNVAAGSMIKGLLMELERKNRNTYIRLKDPVTKGHSVSYTFLEGDKSLICKLARAFGYKQCTDSLLEVRGA